MAHPDYLGQHNGIEVPIDQQLHGILQLLLGTFGRGEGQIEDIHTAYGLHPFPFELIDQTAFELQTNVPVLGHAHDKDLFGVEDDIVRILPASHQLGAGASHKKNEGYDKGRVSVQGLADWFIDSTNIILSGHGDQNLPVFFRVVASGRPHSPPWISRNLPNWNWRRARVPGHRARFHRPCPPLWSRSRS